MKGETYRAQFSPDLCVGSWTNIDSGHYATADGLITLYHLSPSGQGFYRILVDTSFDPPLPPN